VTVVFDVTLIPALLPFIQVLTRPIECVAPALFIVTLVGVKLALFTVKFGFMILGLTISRLNVGLTGILILSNLSGT